MCLFGISQRVSTEVEVTFGDAGRKQNEEKLLTLEFALGKNIPREKSPRNAPDVTPPVV